MKLSTLGTTELIIGLSTLQYKIPAGLANAKIKGDTLAFGSD